MIVERWKAHAKQMEIARDETHQDTDHLEWLDGCALDMMKAYSEQIMRMDPVDPNDIVRFLKMSDSIKTKIRKRARVQKSEKTSNLK